MKMHPNCQGNHLDLRTGVSRRDFLYVGMAGGLGLTLPDLLRLQAAPMMPEVETFKPIADSVIHIYLPGGMAQHESWDPKPFAAPEYRGPYNPIKTSIPGEYVGAKFEKIAKIMNKISVIRSMTHGEAAHERGTHNMFTGYRPSPAIKFPSFGSIISHEQGSRNNLPPYVVVPNVFAPEQGTGYMSSAYGPFALGSDPADKGFTVRDLLSPKEVDDKRFDRRRSVSIKADAAGAPLGTLNEAIRALPAVKELPPEVKKAGLKCSLSAPASCSLFMIRTCASDTLRSVSGTLRSIWPL